MMAPFISTSAGADDDAASSGAPAGDGDVGTSDLTARLNVSRALVFISVLNAAAPEADFAADA